MLLGPATLPVLRRHDPLLRRAEVIEARPELLGETDVAEHEAGLCREIRDQLVVGG
jgi:hypothetical protein